VDVDFWEIKSSGSGNTQRFVKMQNLTQKDCKINAKAAANQRKSASIF
jgi:protein involved in ribonucleotide reduction